jgi:acyl-CoA synthetase (AMP-forming)/AMP-acid ligase II
MGFGLAAFDAMNPSDTWPVIPSVETVHEAIDWWTARTPDAPALLDVTGTEMSFRGLQHAIAAIRARLDVHGVERGDRIVLALPDGVTAAVAGLAASRVAIGVPVNPTQARREAAPMLAAIAPRVVVVASGVETVYRALAAEAGLQVVELVHDQGTGWAMGRAPASASRPSPRRSRSSRSSPCPSRSSDSTLGDIGAFGHGETLAGSHPGPDDIALILLTSGTTDDPRLAPATHRQLLETCAARVTIRNLTPQDRGLSAAPAYFVLGLARVIESLISGGSVIVASAAEIVARPEAVRDVRPTWTWLGPALLETILASARTAPAFAQWPLRTVRTGGALVTPDLIARAEALWGVPVLNGYGTTETLGYISSEESPESIPRKPGSVGLARPGLEVVIRGPDGASLPPGVQGEITVRGDGVFSGYLNDPAATAAASFPGGWFRTGDIGYLNEDGYLFITGRVREMINRGGEKIVPHEIDEVLRSHPAVSDAAAFPLPHPRLGEEAAAAVILGSSRLLSERELRRWAAGRLSPHKVPRRIWIVTELPRTGSGKVQRGELARRFGGAVGG